MAIFMLFTEMTSGAIIGISTILNCFHIFQFSSNEASPSLNEIASTGLDLDLYCTVSRPNNPKKMKQDINVDDFIFENSSFY